MGYKAKGTGQGAARAIARRAFLRRLGAGTAAALAPQLSALPAPPTAPGAPPRFRLRYIVASCMFGRMKLTDILPRVRSLGAEHIDIWPAPHGDQREQIDAMGPAAFLALLRRHRVRLGILTRFDLGPFRLGAEVGTARKLGASLLVCGSGGPANLKESTLKAAVRAFIEKMKPQIAAAEESGIIIGIENHESSLIESPDAMRYLADFAPSRAIGIALAPYHLPQDPGRIAKLIADLGGHLVHFYAWQHGEGCRKKLPKERELLQMPGRGPLDFAPILGALRQIGYRGWTEIFMHPVPRGIPILATIDEVTAEMNRARRYLEARLRKGEGDE